MNRTTCWSARGLLAVLSLVFFSSAWAFDDQRTGFLIGLGGGIQSSDQRIDSDDDDDFGSSQDGLATAIRIGWGLTERFAVYGTTNSVWFEQSGDNIVASLTGLGARYHFSSTRPSVYLHAALGRGDLGTWDEDDVDNSADGSAFLFGAGYEFANRFSVEGSVMTVTADGGFLGDEERDVAGAQLLLGYHWY